MNYLLIAAAAILFSFQFLFNQSFQRENGAAFKDSLTFSIYAAAGVFVIMLVLNRFRIACNLFTVCVALVYAAVCILCSYASFKAISVVNLSKFSIYMMLGGMLLPAVYGIVCFGESMGAGKLVCGLLIIAALFFTYEKGRNSPKEIFYFAAVFIMNGTVGVISKFHQSNEAMRVDSFSFMAVTSAVRLIICLIIYLILERKLPKVNGKSLLYTGEYALCNGIGNLFLLIALTTLPASVQYPMITGGTIVCSAAVEAIRGEKVRMKTVLAVVIALAASVMMGFFA